MLPCNTSKATFKLALFCDSIYLRDAAPTSAGANCCGWAESKRPHVGQESNQPRVWHMIMCSLNRQNIPLDWCGCGGTGGRAMTPHLPPALPDWEPSYLPQQGMVLPPGNSPCPPAESIFTGVQGRDAKRSGFLHSHRSAVDSLVLIWFTWRAPCVSLGALTANITQGHRGARASQGLFIP